MEVQFRPYSLALQITDANEDTVALVDSGGNALKCNFISVEASGADGNTFFRVITNPGDREDSRATCLANGNSASGLITPVDPGGTSTSSPAQSLGITASAVCGGYATVNKGIVEFLFSDFDRVSKIYIQQNEAATTNFWITYGQIQAGNIYRDNDRPVGG